MKITLSSLVVVPMAGVATQAGVRDRYTRLARTTGILGVASLVLLFGPVIALPRRREPSLDASGAEAARYFGTLDATWPPLAMATLALGMITTLWYFVAFGFLLRRAEGDPPWRSTVAILSGGLLAGYGLIGSSTEAAAVHGGRISPDVADYAFASGSVALPALLAVGGDPQHQTVAPAQPAGSHAALIWAASGRC